MVPHGTDIGGQLAVRQAPLPGVVVPLGVVEVVRRPAGVPGIGQRVRQEPASGSLDAADHVAPYRLHEQSLPCPGARLKADFAASARALAGAGTGIGGVRLTLAASGTLRGMWHGVLEL